MIPLTPVGAFAPYAQRRRRRLWATTSSPSYQIDCHVTLRAVRHSAAVNLPQPFRAPIQARYAELAADPGHVDEVLGAGAAKAATIADGVIRRVRDAVGLLPRA